MNLDNKILVENGDNLPKDFLAILSKKGVISLTGEDRVSYLQGQISADVEFLNQHHALLGCHCDFKGKTWNVFYTAQYNEEIHLISHIESIPASLSEFNKYGVFAKVNITDSTDDYVILGGSGAVVEAMVDEWFSDVPFEHQQVFADDIGLVMCLAEPMPRYLIMLKKDVADAFIGKYEGAFADETLWDLLDIQSGIAHIEQATSNEFVPQMMNLHALDAISFTKGCYMGQEVVARTKYLGKNKRSAFILKGEKQHQLKAGQLLEVQVGENWRRGGTILSCSALENETWLLAVLPDDTELDTQFRAKDQPSALFSTQPLPYTIKE